MRKAQMKMTLYHDLVTKCSIVWSGPLPAQEDRQCFAVTVQAGEIMRILAGRPARAR